MPRTLALLLIILFAGCSGNTTFSEFRQVGSDGWARDEVIRFDFETTDTTSIHDIYIHLRNDNTYPYSNLFLIASISFPDGTVVRDTLEYEMARPDGSWLGEGAGSLRENKLFYKEGITFPDAGSYEVQVAHALRANGSVEGVEEVPGITDIGLEIEKRE